MPSTKVPPVIDFSDFLSGEPARMKICADQIRQACLTQGFFQIVNHPIPLDLQKEMFKISKEFFELSLEEKMKLDKCNYIPSQASHSLLPLTFLCQPKMITTAGTRLCTGR